MNHDFSRLVEGMTQTVQQHIIPSLDNEFARGQAFALIYLLRCIGARAGWSSAYLRPQVDVLTASLERLQNLLANVPDPQGHLAVAEAGVLPNDEAALLERRNWLERRLCDLYAWVENGANVPAGIVDLARLIIQSHVSELASVELRDSVAFNFTEISTGQSESRTSTDTRS